MRISNYHKTTVVQNHMSNLSIEQSKKLQEVITGRKFNAPSENPISYNESALLQKTQRKVDQYMSNITDSKNLLEKMDIAMDSAIEVLHIAKNNGLKALTGSTSDKDMEIIAKTIEENIKQLVSLANEEYFGRFMYSGQKTDVKPITYDGETVVYNGNSEKTKINVSTDMKVETSGVASEVFQPLIENLIELRNQMNDGDVESMRGTLDSFENLFDDFIDERSKSGSQLSSVNMYEIAYKETETSLETKRKDVEGVDITKSYSEFENFNNMFEAAIRSSLSSMKLSIINFL